MEERGLPPELWPGIREKNTWLVSRVREIEQAFIDRGFVRTQALIEQDERRCGKGNYDLHVYQQTHQENIEEWRNADSQFIRKLAAFEHQGLPIPTQYIDEILSHPKLTCPMKMGLLNRFFREKRPHVDEVYTQALLDAREVECQRFCRLWGRGEAVRLIGADTLALRKEVMNSVMSYAFGALGFEKRQTKKGLFTFEKRLNDRYAMMIAPDAHSLSRIVHDRGVTFGDYSQTLPVEWSTWLGSPNRRDPGVWYYFRPFFVLYGEHLYQNYNDTRSLEVCIHARALRYELTVGTFEELFRSAA